MNTPSAKEQQLIKESIQGNEKARRQLYERYLQAMYNRVVRMVGRPADAEDIVQESFIKVFSQLHRFKGQSTLGAWIKRITINTALNFIRQQQRVSWTTLEEQTTGLTEEREDAEGPQWSMADIHQAIKELPQGCRLVFTLYLLEGYRHQEIADLLGITASTSKTQYRRAKLLLQDLLKQQKPY
ncbi:MAG: RNA polymerase sigma factor [Bacteroidota bacterium]